MTGETTTARGRELQRRDRIAVRDETGDEREVFGWATVEDVSRVRGSNPTVDTVAFNIYAGDTRSPPDAITHWLADEIEYEYGVDVRDRDDIDVIDPTSEEVNVL